MKQVQFGTKQWIQIYPWSKPACEYQIKGCSTKAFKCNLTVGNQRIDCSIRRSSPTGELSVKASDGNFDIKDLGKLPTLSPASTYSDRVD